MICVYQIPLGFVRPDICKHAPEPYGKRAHEFRQITAAESEMCRQFLKRYLVFKVSSDIRIYLLYSFEHVLRHLVPAVMIDGDIEMNDEQIDYRLCDRCYTFCAVRRIPVQDDLQQCYQLSAQTVVVSRHILRRSFGAAFTYEQLMFYIGIFHFKRP